MNILQEAWPIIVLTHLGLFAMVGLLALASPKTFAFVAETGGLWVTSPKNAAVFDSPIDIDQFVIRNSRQFGALVLMVVCYLTLVFLGRVDPSWTPAFLLLVLGFSVLLASSGLIQLGGPAILLSQRCRPSPTLRPGCGNCPWTAGSDLARPRASDPQSVSPRGRRSTMGHQTGKE